MPKRSLLLLTLIFILSVVYPFTRDLFFGVFHYLYVCISHTFHSVTCQEHFNLLHKEFLANSMSISIYYKAYHLKVSATFYDFLQREYRTFHHNLVFKCYQFIFNRWDKRPRFRTLSYELK